MQKYIFDGKTKSEVIEKAIKELNTEEKNLIINVLEEKNTLLKKNVKIEVMTYNDIIDYLKELITEITKEMGITVNLEVRRREDNITIKIFSDHNALLIGKNGNTIEALQTIVRQIIYNETNNYIGVVLDVENYKDKKVKNIEYLAKKVAREVAKTKVEATLDSMNSYERRIVHSILSEDKYVYTESTGEEPNRCVVIKPKEI
ncbi:MAG: RNA-binding cell elongation regulator Jag/EloR [Mycoplasmatota bacterium]|nr:RNA-binding cell elongation regulator Jag/EloR [Mycoplasmatota bacterium]